jgi:protein SCO1/2
MKPRSIAFAVAAALALVLAVGLNRSAVSEPQPAAEAEADSTATVTIQIMGKIGGPFELVAHTGETVTDADFRGQYMLVFFGYASCPDVCPTALNTIAVALDELGEQAEAVRPLLVSVDPTRDTAEALADYVSLFHPRIIGLTGSPEQVAKAAKAYGASYATVEPEGESGNYLMNHSIFIYLMGPDGELLTLFLPDTDPKEMAAAIRTYLEQGP